VIAAESLTKTLGGKKALNGITFSIPGGIVALIGRNGAGKSTLLRVLAGIWKADSGTAAVGGHDLLTDDVDAKRLLGYQPEHPDLYPSMRPRELLRFAAAARQLDPSRVDAAAAQFGIEELLDHSCGSLSYGQRRLVTLVAATMHEPEVLLLDEPTNALDPHRVAALKSYLRSPASPRAALVATHQLDFIATIASRYILMREGSIVADGSLDALRASLGMPEATLEEIVLKTT
jgi:ABC-2 type transport system ATP-binding protein